jgi:hypothetical protein
MRGRAITGAVTIGLLGGTNVFIECMQNRLQVQASGLREQSVQVARGQQPQRVLA